MTLVSQYDLHISHAFEHLYSTIIYGPDILFCTRTMGQLTSQLVGLSVTSKALIPILGLSTTNFKHSCDLGIRHDNLL